MSNLISYELILKERDNFRKSGTRSGGDFNLLDTPGTKYFKIFFYFNNGDVDNSDSSSISNGLLSPTWLENITIDQLYMYNSAWSYLILNHEDERASLLKEFVNLLSNISSESPWYFSEISGLDEAINRKITMDKEFKIDEERSKISIKCLPDSFDDRIGTLLDLYRSIVWSWTTKREILPANLKKFDMGLLLFETPNIPFHHEKHTNNYSQIGLGESSSYKTSYKYIEFHNCEFDYNSSKGNMGSVSNMEGFNPEYNIDILFDDCYEVRYNESLLKEVGDLIEWDMIDVDNITSNNTPDINNVKDDNDDQPQQSPQKNMLDKKINIYNTEDSNNITNQIVGEDVSLGNLYNTKNTGDEQPAYGFMNNMINQIVGVGEDALRGIVKKAALGNLYTFSLTRLEDQINSALAGNIWSTIRNVDEYIDDYKQRKEYNLPTTHSLFKRPTTITPTVKKIGNLFSNNSLLENI